MNAVIKFLRDEEGLTAIEYVIAAGLLVAGVTTIFGTYGSTLSTKLDAIINRIP